MTEANRVGIGVDFHRLEPGESLILGGVEYEHELGTVAHSDGDVLVHAICDAILGAATLGDIGDQFPDDDPAYKNISSMELLQEVMVKVRGAGFRLVNVDSTLIIEKPKLGLGKSTMIGNLEGLLGVPVNVKATTPEGMGYIGREEGVGAQAIAALDRVDESR